MTHVFIAYESAEYLSMLWPDMSQPATFTAETASGVLSGISVRTAPRSLHEAITQASAHRGAFVVEFTCDDRTLADYETDFTAPWLAVQCRVAWCSGQPTP